VSTPEPADPDDRPLPFVLRVAAEWVNVQDAARLHDDALFFRRRTRLTGTLWTTSDGNDVEFSDIGLTT
jgi:hypothetical protein